MASGFNVDDFLRGLTAKAQDTAASAATSAVTSIENNPEVQRAIAQAQAQAQALKQVAYVVAFAATLTFIFYYVPRFESPLKRLSFGKSRRK